MADIKFGAAPVGAALMDGISMAAARHGLKGEQSLMDAAKSDPVAFQVGSDLGAKLADGQVTSLPEVQACEANAACTGGMEVGAAQAIGDAVGGIPSNLPLTQYALPVGGMTRLAEEFKRMDASPKTTTWSPPRVMGPKPLP